VQTLEAGVRPNAIVLDMSMPVMNGWRFWDWMQGTPFASIPVVVFTATGLTPGAMGASVRLVSKGREPRELLNALSLSMGSAAGSVGS